MPPWICSSHIALTFNETQLLTCHPASPEPAKEPVGHTGPLWARTYRAGSPESELSPVTCPEREDIRSLGVGLAPAPPAFPGLRVPLPGLELA